MKIVPIILLAVITLTGCGTALKTPADALRPPAGRRVAPAPAVTVVTAVQEKIPARNTPVTVAPPGTDIEKCRAQITELKRYNKKLHTSLRTRMARTEKNQAFLGRSEHSGTKETVGYIKYRLENTFRLLCQEASVDLDRVMMAKALSV
jgi:hypothetical protein